MIEGILSAKFTTSHYVHQLQDWRLRATRYGQKMERPLDEDVKVSILLRNSPESIKRQLQLNAEREAYTFEQLYRHITGYLQIHSNFGDRDRLGGQTHTTDDPMDVGVVTEHGGKYGGKDRKGGKGGKATGKGKGKDNHRGKKHGDKCGKTNHDTKACQFFDGNCSFCGTYGHREAHCRQKHGQQQQQHPKGSTVATTTAAAPPEVAVPAPQAATQPHKVVGLVQEAASDEENFMVLGLFHAGKDDAEMVGATCHNAPISFVVDSGSEATILDTSFADELNIPREPSTANLQHVGGGSLSCPEQGVLSGHITDDRNKPLNLEIHCKLGKVRKNAMSVARLVDKGWTVKFSPE